MSPVLLVCERPQYCTLTLFLFGKGWLWVIFRMTPLSYFGPLGFSFLGLQSPPVQVHQCKHYMFCCAFCFISNRAKVTSVLQWICGFTHSFSRCPQSFVDRHMPLFYEYPKCFSSDWPCTASGEPNIPFSVPTIHSFNQQEAQHITFRK